MSDINTGGPAFPSKKRIYKAGYPTAEFEPVGGMTLRDYFAAKAMQSTLADNTYVERTETAAEWLAIVAKSSYEIADAMLSARSTEKARKA
jgi:hypothetical protein